MHFLFVIFALLVVISRKIERY